MFVSILSLIYMRDFVHAQRQVLFFIRQPRRRNSLLPPLTPGFPRLFPFYPSIVHLPDSTARHYLSKSYSTEPTREVCNGDPTSSHRANLLDLDWWATLSLKWRLSFVCSMEYLTTVEKHTLLTGDYKGLGRWLSFQAV